MTVGVFININQLPLFFPYLHGLPLNYTNLLTRNYCRNTWWVEIIPEILNFLGQFTGAQASFLLGFSWEIPYLGALLKKTFAWRIPWTEEPGRLQSIGLHRVRHDWSAHTYALMKQPLSFDYSRRKKRKLDNTDNIFWTVCASHFTYHIFFNHSNPKK